MKELLGIIIIVILLVVGIPFSFQYMEEPHSYFSAYTTDLHNGLWVPNIFPKDIKEIHEQHDIDTNEVWLRFEVGSKQIDLSNYSILSDLEKSNIIIRKPFMASWWFEGIIEQQPANDNALYSNLYKGNCGESMASYLAIPKTGATYYWWCQSE